MAQSSGPISQGTTAERQFTDVLWRARFGDEAGVIADIDGTAYALALPGSGDVVSVGSSTQASQATVAGFVHTIPSGTPEPITIPVASGSSRTDIIGLRYDPSYTGLPGPVRLFRTAGTTSSIPAYDASAPGVEDLPLWAITRAPGQALNLATVVRMFPRIAPLLEVATTSPLPTSSPLGTVVRQGVNLYRRQLNPTTPAWVQELIAPRIITRDHTPINPGVPSGNSRESGVADGPVIAGFTLPTAATLFVTAQFRLGESNAGVGAALPSIKVNGSTISDGAARYTDSTVMLHGVVSLAAGSHTWSVRVQAFGGDVSWTSAKLTAIVGGPE